MRKLLFLGFAVSLLGAQCGTPTGLTRSCPGSMAQTAYYSVAGSCGDEGTISVTLGMAGSCALGVIEPTGVGLPTVGTFNDLASQTDFQLAKGNWNLDDPSVGTMNVGTFLNCTSGTASSTGEINFTCEENVCAVGDTDDVECNTGGTCTAHLTPTQAPPAQADAG
jgi:hypothetical protein